MHQSISPSLESHPPAAEAADSAASDSTAGVGKPSAHGLRTSATFNAAAARADERAVVTVRSADGAARFTVLTPGLVRLEWQPTGHGFEDRPSFAVIRRALPVPEFTVQRDVDGERGKVVITTSGLRILYRPLVDRAGSRFSAKNLLIERIEPDPAEAARWPFVWTPGTPGDGNLGGTVRTLDGVSGGTALPGGLLSREGWSLVDDSDTPVFEEITTYDAENRAWPTARWHMQAEHSCVACGTVVKEAGARHAGVGAEHPSEKDEAPASVEQAPAPIDWYFFGHGRDYAAALNDFALVSGRIPVPPRYALGVWWSRYWAYSDAELKGLVGEFASHGVPLDVLVIDMDWHLDGWTGYSWNPEYFPEPEAFLDWCHEQNLRTTLNLHPADGVGKHERAFHEFARAMGKNTFSVYRVPFDCTDPKFVDLYFELLHHPLEQQGVDFWWMDWQQGTATTVPGLDPLPWLNHLHWADMEHGPRANEHRPLVFSRWGGLGNHRYQVGFSGDTYNDWASLAFQPRFTATAGNVGYAWWSHDIGGHQPGPVEPELYVRWIQFGITSPVLRTHASKNPQAERRIWAFPEAHFEAAREAFLLRMRLIPYLYSCAHQTHRTTLPLLRPLYLEWSMLDAAYEHPDEYLLGGALLCAPVLEPAEASTGVAETMVWLPPGHWAHWFSGRMYEGPGFVVCRSVLDEFPLFLRGGSAVPLAPAAMRSAEITGEQLTLRVARPGAGEHRVSELVEDDGVSPAYLRGAFGTTKFVVSSGGDGRTTMLEIGPTVGVHEGQPASRSWCVELLGAGEVIEVLVDGRALPMVSLDVLSACGDGCDVVAKGDHDSIQDEAESSPVSGWAVDDSSGVLHMRLLSAGVRDLTWVQVTHAREIEAESASEARPGSERGSVEGRGPAGASVEAKKPVGPNASPRRPRGL